MSDRKCMGRTRAQSGQAMAEYLAVLSVLVLALWVGTSGSIWTQLENALATYFSAFTYSITLP